jgi:hypothetical protein
MFLKADHIMKNNEVIVDKAGLARRHRVLTAGWCQTSLIDHILDRPNMDGTSFKSIEEIVAEFVKRVCGEATAAPAAAVVEATASSSDVVQYNAAGEAIDVAKMVVMSTGFVIGEKYHSTKTGHDEPLPVVTSQVWKLNSIDGDGTAVLQAYSNIGELTEELKTIAGNLLMKSFVRFDKLFKTLPNYPKNEGKYNASMKADILAGRIKECLMGLAESMIDLDLTVRIQPSRALYANSEFGLGKLRLSPVSSTVTLLERRKNNSPPNPRLLVTHKRPDGKTTQYQMSSPSVDETTCSAFFVLQVTPTEELANMVMTYEDVSFILAAKKLKIAGHEHSVKIPVFSNNKIIKKGEELLTFVKKEEKPRQPPVVQELALKAKRARI